MAARHALSSSMCHGCRRGLGRSITPFPSGPSAKVRSLAQATFIRPRTTPITQSAVRKRNLTTKSAQDDAITDKGESKHDSPTADSSETPWYLQVAPPQLPTTQHKVDLPQIPEDAPSILEPMMKYIFEDMGLDEISLLDLRGLEQPAALGSNLIMLFGTARSERHLHISSGRFVRWLRKNQVQNARADGLIGPGELKTKLRRLRKKAKLMGTNTAIIPGGDNGISTGWVCINFTTNDGASGESVNHDVGGRLSGFGAAESSTTIVVQCLTESRRSELDLESLWKGNLKRSIVESRKIRGEVVPDSTRLESLVASRLQISTSPGESQWQAMKRASQQHRYFSTSNKKLEGSRFSDSSAWKDRTDVRPGRAAAPRSSKQSGRNARNVAEVESDLVTELKRTWNAPYRRAATIEPDEDEDDADWGTEWDGWHTKRQATSLANKFPGLGLAEDVAANDTKEGGRSADSTVSSGESEWLTEQAKLTAAETGFDVLNKNGNPHLMSLRKEIQRVQLAGIQIDEDVLFQLITGVWLAHSAESNTIKERIRLVDDLIQVAEERGMQIWSPRRIIEFIAGVVNSPVYGPELRVVQENLEYLLRSMKMPPAPQETLKLMQTYASQQNWDRFWDTFRTPSRFMLSRTEEQYQLVYEAMTMTNNPKMCTDALRWVYPEMLKEDPPVIPTGALFEALRTCILTADPAAEQIMRDPPTYDGLIPQRQVERREFVRVLKQAYQLRDEMTGNMARRQMKAQW